MAVSAQLFKVVLALCLLALSAPGLASFEVAGAHMRKPLPGQSTTVIYLQLTNRFDRDVQLASVHLVPTSADVESRIAGAVVEVHEHRHIDGMMSMRKVSGLTIAAGDSLAFQPGGYHLMVFGVTSVEEPLELLLRFSGDLELRVPLRVKSL